jgi:hypothetical protein
MPTGKTLYISGTKGVVAIFDENTNIDVLDNPLNYTDKINFHTGLPYIRFITSISTTVTFSAVDSDTIEWTDNSGGCC